MRLLITGACGFLGRHAITAAIERGWEVEMIDLAYRGSHRGKDTRKMESFWGNPDCVLHLAAFSSNAGFADNLAENYDNNVRGLWNVLRLAQQCGARVVYASSSAVYGNGGCQRHALIDCPECR
jgi:nucleoside-diphosphate-sugar epimerase